jgi:uncharacterized protein YecT (DUF1311 family)
MREIALGIMLLLFAVENAEAQAQKMRSGACVEQLRTHQDIKTSYDYLAVCMETGTAKKPSTQGTHEGPSFNCAKAESASARLVCSDAELSKADADMAVAYQSALNEGKDEGDRKALKKMQLAWIKARNSKCGLDGKNNVLLGELTPAKPCFLDAYKRQKIMLVTAFAGASVGSAHGVENNRKVRVGVAPPAYSATGTQRANSSIRMIPRYTKSASACPGCSNGIQTGKTFVALDFISPAITGAVVCVDSTSQGSEAIGIGLAITEQNAGLFFNEEYIKNLLNSIRSQAYRECSNALRKGVLLDNISMRAKGVSEYAMAIGTIPAGNQPAFQAFSPSLHDAWTITHNLLEKNERARIEQVQAHAVEQQRQRDEVERQRQQEIAQAKIDAQSGDPLIGNWKGENMTLRITKNGSLYLVHVNNNGGPVGDYAGSYKDDQIILGGELGNLALLSDKTQLMFSGVMFTKAGQ